MFLTLSQAKAHCRIDGTDGDADLTLKIAAAERLALEYLQCDVYADQPTLDAAIAAVPAQLSAAKAAYEAAYAVAVAIEDVDLSLNEQAHAMSVYMRAVYAATRTRAGIVINDLILSAMLLIVGHLYANREDVGMPTQKLPNGAEWLLQPYRVYT